MEDVTQAPAPDPLTLRDRLLAATYQCVVRFGLGKTTVEDIVKESGVSRATIYRQFPGGRDELLLETTGWELANYFTALADHVRDAPDLAQLLEQGLAHARGRLVPVGRAAGTPRGGANVRVDRCPAFPFPRDPPGVLRGARGTTRCPRRARSSARPAASPRRDVLKRIAAARAVRELGFEPMPHFSARRITSALEFEHYLYAVVARAGVQRCFVVAGLQIHQIIGSHKLEKTVGIFREFAVHCVCPPQYIVGCAFRFWIACRETKIFIVIF